MKLSLLALLVLAAFAGHAQVKDYNGTRQVAQLQQLKQNIERKIDSLQMQLPELAVSIDDTRKKIDQLKKDANNQDKPDVASRGQISKLSLELNNATTLAEKLKKKFDSNTSALNKALNLQRNLEEKINALAKESNL